jgi:hypothetical protein
MSVSTTSRQHVWGQYVDELVQMKTYVDTGSQPLSAGAHYPQSESRCGYELAISGHI